MRKNLHHLKYGLVGLSVTALTISGSAAFALPPQAQAHAATTAADGSSHQPASPGSQGAGHLAAAQLRSCQNRQNAINTIITRINTRGENQLTLFSTIASRVEAFATTKNVTVSNYSQLTATLQSDKTAASNDLAAMKANGPLDCSASDPKGMVSAFQSDLKTEIKDLQTYRTDIKNLIVAVKTALTSSSTSSNDTSASTTTTTNGGNQ